MAEQGNYENVQGLIDGLKGDDPNLGGELFKPQFQALREQCTKDMVNQNRISQHVDSEVTSGVQDKE